MKKIKKIGLILIAFLVGVFVYIKATSSDEFKNQENPASNSPLAMFDKSAVIFDAVTIYGTNLVPVKKLEHAAKVTAQWLDNDQDGQIDDENLQKTLIKNKPVVLMSKDGFSTLAFTEIMAKLSVH